METMLNLCYLLLWTGITLNLNKPFCIYSEMHKECPLLLCGEAVPCFKGKTLYCNIPVFILDLTCNLASTNSN